MSAYKEDVNQKYRERTEQLLTESLPDFCKKFYTLRNLRLSPKTQFDYASKMKIFLDYLHDNNTYFGKKSITEYTFDDLTLLTSDDFQEFAGWLLNQPRNRQSKKKDIEKNKIGTVDNYMACLSSYMSFFFKKGWIPKNPILEIERTKKTAKPIIYLRDDDRSEFMNVVSTGEGLTKKQKSAWDKTKLRETCMMQLLIDTGIRVSELVGLNISDVNLKHCYLSIQRKGNKPDHAYFSDSTADLLTEYIEHRKNMYVQDEGEQALFLVSQGKYKGTRLGVRTLQLMVKKFADTSKVSDASKITPHKLRSTYAMAMLKATHNQAVVQQQLGHKNISTTSLYAQGTEEDKIENRNQIFPY